MRTHFYGLAVSILALTVVNQPARAAAPDYKVVQTMTIGGEGRWDYVTFDAASKQLYVPRQSHTQVINSETGKVVADIADTDGVHGVALAPELNRGFTSNGKGNSITVFDLKTNQAIGTIPAGKGPDGILYDPFSKSVLSFNGKSNDVTVAAADGNPAEAKPTTVALGGKPETPASDGNGRVYVAIEDTAEIAVIDTKAMKVTDRWKLDAEEPAGLAIDTAHHRLFVGCHNQLMVVVDYTTGKTIGTAPIGKGVDACAFDAGTGEAFASCGDGTTTVVKETAEGKFEVVQTVATPTGARTLALDPVNHRLYLPTADFEPIQPGQKRPTAKPGTFKIVVVAQDKM